MFTEKNLSPAVIISEKAIALSRAVGYNNLTVSKAKLLAPERTFYHTLRTTVAKYFASGTDCSAVCKYMV